MSSRVVARKNVSDARAGALAVVAILFVAVFGVIPYGVLSAGAPRATVPAALYGPVVLLVPLTAVMLSYESVAAERERGTLRLLLTLPHSRRDVVLGMFAGRVVVLAFALLVGFAAGVVGVLAAGGSPPGPGLLGFVSVTLALAAVYASVGVAVSAAVSTPRRAMVVGLVAVFGIYAWDALPDVATTVLNALLGASLSSPAWVELYRRLDPVSGFTEATTLLSLSPSDGIAASVSSPGPWLGLAVLAAWTALPLALGALRFERADL